MMENKIMFGTIFFFIVPVTFLLLMLWGCG